MEESQMQLLDSIGKIPNWIEGVFIRAGGMPVQINQKKQHWFDEPAILYSFSFNRGNVLFSNKFLRSEVYKTIFINGSFNYDGFATKGDNLLFDNIKNLFTRNKYPKIQNANVNLAKIGSHYVALTEMPLPVKFDLQTLNTLGALEFHDNLPYKNIFESAHIQQDAEAKEQINYLVDYGRKSKYVIYHFNETLLQREVIGKIDVEKPSYMHSFAITKNYIILVEFPLVINPIDLFLKNKPFIKNFTWEPERGTNFIIVSRNSGKLIKSIKYHDPFFAFHHVNAYESGDNVVLDIITYSDPNVIEQLADHGNLQLSFDIVEKYRPQLKRYNISVGKEFIAEEVLLDESLEFPRINSNYNSKEYSYIYAVDPRLLSSLTDLRPIYKINTHTRTKLIWQEPGLLPGEPLFVANPTATSEDDGVVMSLVLNVNMNQSFLLILDAKSFKEIARIYTPYIAPFGLHGQFFTHN